MRGGLQRAEHRQPTCSLRAWFAGRAPSLPSSPKNTAFSAMLVCAPKGEIHRVDPKFAS
jgi:hypothetical protein